MFWSRMARCCSGRLTVRRRRALAAPVGSFPDGASPYGVLDMAGNVWEILADSFDNEYYVVGPERNSQEPGSGDERVLRGGSFHYRRTDARCAFRDVLRPIKTNGRNFCIGFRLASSTAPQ